MQLLDDNFLVDVGLGALPADVKAEMLRDIYSQLELNVGTRLAAQMSDTQLDEFESIMDKQDDSLSVKWLETNLPDYRQVVNEELEKLKVELRRDAPAFLAKFGGHLPSAA